MHISYDADISEENTEASISVFIDRDDPTEVHRIGVRCENPRLMIWLTPLEAARLTDKLKAAVNAFDAPETIERANKE